MTVGYLSVGYTLVSSKITYSIHYKGPSFMTLDELHHDHSHDDYVHDDSYMGLLEVSFRQHR